MFFANKFNHVFILIIFCIFLSSCGPSPDEPIATATPSPTIKPAPTFTPAPIVSPTIEANYSFRLDSEIVDVFWNDDGSLSLSYAFTFANDPSVSPIDYVDINIPSQNFLLRI